MHPVPPIMTSIFTQRYSTETTEFIFCDITEIQKFQKFIKYSRNWFLYYESDISKLHDTKTYL